MEINFPFTEWKITQITMWGGGTGAGYVTVYRLAYSGDLTGWSDYSEGGRIRVRNISQVLLHYSLQTSALVKPAHVVNICSRCYVISKYLLKRMELILVIKSWFSYPCLRRLTCSVPPFWVLWAYSAAAVCMQRCFLEAKQKWRRKWEKAVDFSLQAWLTTSRALSFKRAFYLLCYIIVSEFPWQPGWR